MGGKKKSAKAPLKKESKYKVPKVFNCPICDAKAAMVVLMLKKSGIARLRCRNCNQPNPPFEVDIHRLSLPVDAFLAYYESVRKEDQATLHQHGITVKAGEKPKVGTLADAVDVDDVFQGADNTAGHEQQAEDIDEDLLATFA